MKELRIWPALDERLGNALIDTHENLATRLAENPHVKGFKIHGPFRSYNLKSSVAALSRPQYRGGGRTRVFVDDKVYGADSDAVEKIERIRFSGAEFATVAAAGGKHMMKTARSVAHNVTLIAITVPTTQPDAETCVMYKVAKRSEAVKMLAEDALQAGIRDIVCSGRDLPTLFEDPLFDEVTFWIPGIRPHWADWIKDDDQIHWISHIDLQRIANGRKINHILGRVLFHRESNLSPWEAAEQYCEECLRFA